MQELNMIEIDYVSGGEDVQVVEIHGTKMSFMQKREYDMEHMYDSVGDFWRWWSGSWGYL